MNDYVLYGWCKEIHQQPAFQDAALEALQMMGVPMSPTASSDAICAALARNTCKILKDGSAQKQCDNPDELPVRCGYVTTCQPVDVLYERLRKDAKYASKFSVKQRRLARLKKMLSSGSRSPCTMYRGSKASCSKATNGRCTYHVGTMWASLWSQDEKATLLTNCFLSEKHLKRMLGGAESVEFDRSDFDNAVYDVVMFQAHMLDGFVKKSDRKDSWSVSRRFHEHLMASDWVTYRTVAFRAAQKMTDAEQREFLQLHLEILNPKERRTSYSRALLSEEGFQLVRAIGKLHSSRRVDVVAVQQSAAVMGYGLKKWKARILAFLLNAGRASIDCLFSCWSYYHLTAYVGYDSLRRVATDPVCFALYLAMAWQMGLPNDFVFGPVSKQMQAVAEKAGDSYVTKAFNESIAEYDLDTRMGVLEEKSSHISAGQLPWKTIGNLFATMAMQRTKMAEGASVFRSAPKEEGVALSRYGWKLENLGLEKEGKETIAYAVNRLSMLQKKK